MVLGVDKTPTICYNIIKKRGKEVKIMFTVKEVLDKGLDTTRDYGKKIEIMNATGEWFDHRDALVRSLIVQEKKIKIYLDK